MARAPQLIFSVFLTGCGFPGYAYNDGVVVPDGEPGADADIASDGEVPSPDGCAKPNGCGGCDDQGIKGQRCEPCGQWVCDGTLVRCEPASPAVGTKCGLCGSSTTTCTAAGTTTCALEDDRLVYEDASYKGNDRHLFVVDRSNEVFIAFDSVRSLSYVDGSIYARRVPYVCAHTLTLPHPDNACDDCKPTLGGAGYDCTVKSPTVGALTLSLYTGSVSSRVPLATGAVAASVVADSPGWVTAPFSTPVSARPPGTKLILGITTDSSGHAFQLFGEGGFPLPPSTTTWWRRSTRPEGTLTEEPANDLAHVLRGKACAP